jgi:NTE family protein
MLACAAIAQTDAAPQATPAPAVGTVPAPTIPPKEKPSAVTAQPVAPPQGPISQGQTLTAPGRQKIGLVLNGGGALGLAHVGVLRWLEEHHIPIDMVAGTSMGGLVGGAYATGDSPAEVKAFVEGIDWNRVLSDQAPYRDISYRRKEDALEFPTAIQFGFDKKGLRIQGGYKSGQQVQLLLDQMALPYSQVTNFDDLPIPFGCVATDLVSGRPHIFRSGSLSLALRSTMSLPGIFSPVHVDNAIYADGGLLDNLPVDVAQQMGANITLAIYLQTAPLPATTHLSSVGVLGRGISVMIAANELRSMQQADILVSVPLDKFSTLDYDKADAIIQAGYDAAQAKATVLEKLSVDDATWDAYLARRNARKRAVPIPQYIAVTRLIGENAKAVQEALAPDLNKPIVPAEIARQLTTLASNQRMANLSYGLATNEAGIPGIDVYGTKDVFGRNIVRPLVLVDGWDFRNVTFSMGARLTMMDVGAYGAELRVDGLFGSDFLLNSEYYRPLGEKRRFFVAPREILDDVPLNYYDEGGLIAEYRTRTLGGGVDVGEVFQPSAELRLGYEAAYLKIYPNVVDPATLPTRVSGREGNTHARFVYEGLDDPITPHSGLRLTTNWEWWDAHPVNASAYPVAELRALDFIPVKSDSVYLGASGGSTLWTNPPILPPPFTLGGSFRMPAYNTNELLTNQYFLFQGGYTHKLAQLSPLLGGKMLGFIGSDVGKAYYYEPASKVSRLPADGAAGIVINTVLGPIVVGGAIGDRGHHKFFFEFGRTYF